MLKIAPAVRMSLASQMQPLIDKLATAFLAEKRFDLLIYCGFRSGFDQNRLYCMSRTHAQIDQKVVTLRKQGFDKLADYLEAFADTPRTASANVTNATAGESLHNYGLAIDAVPTVGNKALWNNSLFYKTYGDVAEACGLDWAGNWTTFREFPHSQIKGYDDMAVVRRELMSDYMENIDAG